MLLLKMGKNVKEAAKARAMEAANTAKRKAISKLRVRQVAEGAPTDRKV
jgi:hypothetical protein